VAHQQRLLLAGRQHHRLDRVLSKKPQRAQPLVTVHDTETLRLATQRRHHDRHLLTVLVQRAQQLPLPGPITDPEILVVQVQLVELEIHRHTLR
jgi:hypothetical protein